MLVQLNGEKYFLKPTINEQSALGERRPRGECTVTTIRFSIWNLFKVQDDFGKRKNEKERIFIYTLSKIGECLIKYKSKKL